MREYEVLEVNKIFDKIENDNPYRARIEDIYDKELHKNQHYYLYY